MLNPRKEGLCLFNLDFKEKIGYHVYSECYVLVFCWFSVMLIEARQLL